MDPLIDHEKRIAELEEHHRRMRASARTTNRRRLTGNTTLYVRVNGNDTNTGRANTDAKAFATIQAAINTACEEYESSIYSMTIQVQDGTWVHPTTLILRPHQIAGGIVLNGNQGSPSSCIFQLSAAGWLLLVSGASPGPWILNGLSMGRSTTGFDINTTVVRDHGLLHVQNCNFGNAGSGTHLLATNLAQIKATGPYSMSGGAYRHMLADRGATVDLYGGTITATGTPTFTHWAEAYRGSRVIHQNSAPVSGAVTTSIRYYLSWLAMAEGIANMPGTGGTADASSVAF